MSSQMNAKEEIMVRLLDSVAWNEWQGADCFLMQLTEEVADHIIEVSNPKTKGDKQDSFYVVKKSGSDLYLCETWVERDKEYVYSTSQSIEGADNLQTFEQAVELVKRVRPEFITELDIIEVETTHTKVH